MRILALASSGVLGGSELALAEFLLHRPPEADFVALLLEDGPLRGRLLEQGVPTFLAHGCRGRPSAAQMVRFSRSMLRMLERADPDVVWATGLKAAFMAVPACRLRGIPVVWQKVDFSLDSTLTLPLAAAVDGVVSVSEAVAEALGPLRARRLLAVVGPPPRLAEELEIVPAEDPLAIGTLGTLTPIKGQQHIIEAAALLSREFPQLRVLLAGGGTREYPQFPAELRSLAERLGISERVELSGFVEDVTEVLSRLTVFVSATYRDERGFGGEGFGAAILEASWVGLPVVVTRGGGSAEAMQDPLTGTLVAPRDPAALAAAIAPYLREPELARATGAAGRRFARERFGPATLAVRQFAALERAAERRRRQRTTARGRQRGAG